LAELGRWWIKTTGEQQPQAAVTSSAGAASSAKMKLLSEVRNWMFFDTVFKVSLEFCSGQVAHGQILHVHRSQNVHFELYVTDGTVSPLSLRNYHNISHGHIPRSAIYCVSIQNEPPPEELQCYEAGNVLRLTNLRAKEYRGELEITWSDLMTEVQANQNFKRRKPLLLPKEDERSIEIEK
jgi:hypothetical protein